jgi:hypothetical protein
MISSVNYWVGTASVSDPYSFYTDPDPALLKHEISSFFLLLWVIFALLDPDPDSESGSTDLIESGSNPDPKHWVGRHKVSFNKLPYVPSSVGDP